jgi:CDP-6-deoxy-D-xylo-4-hexulose-3-dehydrase
MSRKEPNTLIALSSSTWDEEELRVAKRVLDSGNLSMGKEVAEFEETFAATVGSRFAVMFNSGSSANLGLFFALKYGKDINLKQSSEVIVPAVSWSTSFYPISQAGFKLRFVDVNHKTLNIDPDKVLENINDKTGAILAVNLLGNPSELSILRDIAESKNIILLEDNCESLGATLGGKQTGTFGIAGTYSFYFSHHICTMEGGMVVTDSQELQQVMRSIRAHGWTRGLPADNLVHPLSLNPWEDLFRFVLPGFNLRPLEISGAVGKTQLSKLDNIVQMRRLNAQRFVELFSDSKYFSIQEENGESSWFGFSLILKDRISQSRTKLIDLLTNSRIETRPIVAGNFLRNPVMKHLDFIAEGTFINADLIHDRGFFIGNHHFDFRDKLEEFHQLIENFAMKESK